LAACDEIIDEKVTFDAANAAAAADAAIAAARPLIPPPSLSLTPAFADTTDTIATADADVDDADTAADTLTTNASSSSSFASSSSLTRGAVIASFLSQLRAMPTDSVEWHRHWRGEFSQRQPLPTRKSPAEAAAALSLVNLSPQVKV
jgi:hypothetical protein